MCNIPECDHSEGGVEVRRGLREEGVEAGGVMGKGNGRKHRRRGDHEIGSRK